MGINNIERAKAYREKREQNTSALSSNVSRAKQYKLRQSGSLDTLWSDFDSTNNLINDTYSSWQDAKTLDASKQKVLDMKSRLSDYSDAFGIDFDDNQRKTIQDAIASYDTVLGSWDDTAALYGYYKTADAFNAAMEKQKNAKAVPTVYESKYAKNAKNADYADRAKYVAGLSANDEKSLNNKVYSSKYEYINTGDWKPSVVGSMAGFDSEQKDRIDHMTDEEKQMYNYIYATQGGYAADVYLNDIANDLSKRSYDEASDRLKQWQDNHGLIGNALASAGATLGQLALSANPYGTTSNTTAEMVRSMYDPNYSPYAGVSGAYNFASEVNSNIIERLSNATDSKVLNEALKIGGNAATMFLPNRWGQRAFGPAYNVIMGTGAYLNKYKESLEQGLDQETAVYKASAAGLIEFLTEQIGMEWAIKGSGSTALKTILKQARAEGMEEVVGNAANILSDLIYDKATGKEVADYQLTYQEYVDRGFTPFEALGKTVGDNVLETVEAYISAALSAGVEGGGHELGVANTGKNVNRKAFEEAMGNMDKTSAQYADYLALLDKYDQDLSKASNWEIGKSYRENLNESIKSVYESKSQEEVYDNLSKYSDMALAGDKKAAEEAVMKNSKQFKEEYVQKLYTDNYKGQQLKNYDTNFRMIITDAAANISVEEMLKDINTSVISKADAMSIYQAAVEHRITSDAAVRNLNNEMMAKWNGKYKGGSIKFGTEDKEHPGVFKEGSIEDLKLTSQEKQLVGFFNLFAAKGMKINVIADDSSTSSNGFHTNDDGSITVNLRARFYVEKQSTDKDNEYAIPTFAHESTHWMEDILGEEFNTFRDIVKNFMGTAEWNDAIARQKKAGTKNENIESEIIARFCEGMIDDASVVDRLVTTADESKIRRVIKAVRKWFSELREDIQKLIKGYSPQSEEAKYARQFEKEFKAIQDMWVDMFQRALVKNQVVSDYTENESTQFSGKQTIESDGKLIAMHNLTTDQLLKTVKLGGFALPSIAIMKQYMPHTEYGDVTVVFPKGTINPAANSKNEVYSADAWTPSFPTISKKVSEKAQKRIEKRILDILGGRDAYYALGTANLDYDNMMDKLNRNSNPYDAYGNNDIMKYAFMKDTGKGFDVPKKEKTYSNLLSNDSLGAIALIMKDELEAYRNQGYQWFSSNKDTVDRIRLMLNEAYIKENSEKLNKAGLSDNVLHHYQNMFGTAENGMDFSNFDRIARAMISMNKGRETVTDTEAFREKLRDINEDEYKAWLDELFEGVIEKEGIRNNADYYTSSGNRRSWEALHWEVTLENIAKAMLSEAATGSDGFFAGNNFFGAAVKSYKNIDEMRKDMGRLVTQNEEEREKLRKQYSEELSALGQSIQDGEGFGNLDSALEALVDAIRKYKTVKGIDSYLRREYSFLNLKADTAQRTYNLFQKIANMPTEYYEAKPMRVVSLDEVSYVVIPNNAPASLIKALNDNGITYKTFEAGNDDDRVRVVNENASEAEGTLFSKKLSVISDNGDDFSKSFSKEEISDIATLLENKEGKLTLSGYNIYEYGNKMIYSKFNRMARVVTIDASDNKTIKEIMKEIMSYENSEQEGSSFINFVRISVRMFKDVTVRIDFGQDSYTDAVYGRDRQRGVRKGTFENSGIIEIGARDIGKSSNHVDNSHDSTGKKLSLEQEKFFKKSAIRDGSGRLLKLYHGSYAAPFSVFSENAGIWLSTEREYALEYADYLFESEMSDFSKSVYDGSSQSGNLTIGQDKIYALYANIERPLHVGYINGYVNDSFVRFLFKQIGIDNLEDYEFLTSIADEFKGQEAWNITNDERFRNLAKKYNFDGLAAAERNNVETYCAFYSNQVKLTTNTNPTKDKDIRFSNKVDSEGTILTESQAEYFKDSKIRDDKGNLVKVYHGSDEYGFTAFDTLSPTEYGSHFGTKAAAARFDESGEKTYEGYLNITNPIRMPDIFGSVFKLSDYVNTIHGRRDQLIDGKLLNGVTREPIKIINTKQQLPINEAFEEYTQAAQDLAYDDFGDEILVAELAQAYLKSLGFDGVIYENAFEDKGNDSYIIFDPEQFKRADNLNPTKDRDMRFSQKINSEGDKLTEGQAAYFKNSKVRDDDGNLKVMYHGSRSAGFTIFQRMYSDDNRSFFFTDKKSIAYGYNSTNEEYIPDKHYSYEELASMISGYTNGEQYLEKNGNKIILNYYEEESYEEKQREYDSLDAVRDDFIDYINRFRGVSAPATYKVYLNATNPLVIDADFNNWDEITPGEFSKEYRQLHIVRDGDTYSIEYDDEDWNHHEETLTAKEFDKRFGYGNGVSVGMGQEEDYEWLYVDKYGDVIPTNTREYSAFAKAHGYDSVIFNNIVDTGIYAPDFNEVSQVVVVFDANQIKSVANVNPTEDEDIRFSQKVMPDDIFGVNKELEKENEKLRNDIDRLKKKLALERKVTNGGVLDESKLELAVKKILKEANSSYDKETLKKELKEFYEGILNSKTPETLNWDSLMGQAEEIARKVFAKQRAYKYTDDYAASILADIRRARIRLTDEQKQEARNAYGDDWRNAFLGRIMIVNDGMSLDSYWSEWSEMYPWVFDADVNPNDQITALSEIYDDLRRLKESEVYYRGLEERRALAIEIYNQFWNIPTVTTISDKYSKDISRLKLQHRQEMEQLKKEHTLSISEIKKEASEQKLADSIYYGKQLSRQQKYYQDAIKRIREEKNQQLADYKEYVKNRNISEREANARKALVNKITNESMTLMDWMNKNSKKEHVPEALKPLVKEFVGAIDYSSRRALGQVGGSKAGIPTQKDKSLRRAIDRIYKMVLNSNTEEGMTELETFVHFPDAYKERLAELSTDVNTIAAKLGEDNEYVLNEMTVEQLESLYEAVRLLKTVVTSLNKAIAGAYNYTIASTAQEDIQYHKELGSKKSKAAVLEFLRKFFKWDSALPIYAFDYLGPGAQKMFTEVQDGWDKFSFNVKKVIAFAEESFTPEQRKAWSEEIKDFEVLVLPTEAEEKKGGKAHKESIQMTTAQVMSLYCLSKREHAKAHFAGGGIRVATIKNKGKEIVQTKNVRLSEEALEDIIGSLTKEQIAVADKLQEFMNTVCSDWGNEVTMKLYGIKGYTEKNYFPIKVDSNILPTDNRDNEKSIYALLNMSFTKPIKPHANNQMEIGDIFDVFTIHTSEMAKYNSIALPVLDMVKWYSYKEKDQDGNVTALKGSIEQTFGKDAKSYIMHFLNDLNGNQESGRGDSYLKKLTRAYKTSAVAANLQVAALQPISIFRATAVMDGKYLFMGANPAKIKRGMQKAAKYSGIANWKSMSLFDTNVSRGLDAAIKRDDNWYDKTIEASMKLAEMADEVTWGAIWNACEYEVKNTPLSEEEKKLMKDMTDGQKEEHFYEKVNKRFRDVIYRTQVVDSTMTRTDLMRSSSLATQWVTSFMSEPSVGLNVLTNAVVKFNQDSARFGSGEALKRNGKIIRMAAVGYSLSALAEGVLRGLAAKWRDWDDDDTTVLQKMWQEFWSNMNILNNIPVVKDVISIFKGYNVNRMDVSWAQSAYYAFTSIQKNGITYKSVYRIIQAISGVSGVPLANAMREVKTLWNNTIGNFYPDLKFKD